MEDEMNKIILVLIILSLTAITTTSVGASMQTSENNVSVSHIYNDKVYSSVEPDVIYLRKTEIVNSQLYLVLKVRSNIESIFVDDQIQWKYSEVEIKYPVKSDCLSEDQIANYILDNYSSICNLANAQKSWENINKESIKSDRLRLKVNVSKSESDILDLGLVDKVKTDRLAK